MTKYTFWFRYAVLVLMSYAVDLGTMPTRHKAIAGAALFVGLVAVTMDRLAIPKEPS
jgi:hypothetical protein